MKKILAGVLALSMVLVISSCGKDDKSSKKSKDSKEKAAVTSETEETTEESSESKDSSSEVIIDSSNEVDIDKSKLTYDFKGLASEPYITVLTSDKYMLKYSVPDYGMSQTVYLDGENEFMTIEMSGIEYSMLYLDKAQYMLGNNQYAKDDSKITDIEGLGVSKMFSNFALYESGEEDIDGKTYKYDEYYQESADSLIKLLISEDGDLYALESQDVYMLVDEFSADFDSSKIMAIPEGATEVSADELRQSLYGRASDEDAGAGAVDSSIAE